MTGEIHGAPEGPEASEVHTELRLVCFELLGQEFALPITNVRETIAIQPITRVFLTPPALAGVFGLRGEIVPAIDLAPLLGLARTVVGDASKIVVLKHARGTAGIVVDRLHEQRRIAQELAPPPDNLPPEVAALLLGVVATETGVVRVLDAGAILAAEPFAELARPPE